MSTALSLVPLLSDDAKAPRMGLDRYLVRREIATGGMGMVHEAEHALTGRCVALKRLRPDLVHDGRLRARLLREARALGAARHPGVVEILDAGVGADGAPYIVMEMLEGRPLDGILISRTRLPVEQAVRLVIEACEAAAFAHDHGVVHRDLKPGNLFLAQASGAERLKLLDFGSASIDGVVDAPADRKLTGHGEILGTPEYMAPEQLLGSGSEDRRCDVYALGVVLFECLTGQVPFAGSYPQVLLQVSVATEPPSARALWGDVPASVDAVIRRALAKDPAARFPDARQLSRALADAIARTPTRAEDPAADAGAQRRRVRRAPYLTPVRIFTAHGALDGRSQDISEGGLLVVTQHPCRDGEAVRVRFALPGTGRIVTLDATARWARAARGSWGAVGLELAGVPPEARATISEYVTWMSPPAS